MQTRTLIVSDFPILHAWWRCRGEGIPPADVLPPLAHVALDGDSQPVAAAFVYEPRDCKVVFVDWLVSRPGETAGYSRAAIRAVLDAIATRAAADGKKFVLASVTRRGALREARSAGFHICAESCTHLAKHLP